METHSSPATASPARPVSGPGASATLERGAARNPFIRIRNLRPDGEDPLAPFAAFPPVSGTVAAQMVFGGCGFHAAASARMGGADWPMLWLQGDVSAGTRVHGMQALVLDGQSVRRVRMGDRVVGSAWSDADADYCLLAGVLPADQDADREAQTTSCFEQIEAALGEAGMAFAHVVRTWFYLDHLLDWYDGFNAARTRFFASRGVFDGLVPASTGIGASHPAGAALVAGALAIRPRHAGVSIREVASPLQNPATEYRSSFSRAVEIGFPDHRLLSISGTASIAPDGGTVFVQDVAAQIQLTLQVVEGILASRGMGWRDTVRAVGYFHDIRAVATFEACCRARGLPPLPMVHAHATVCRADLLFELELDAMTRTPAPGAA